MLYKEAKLGNHTQVCCHAQYSLIAHLFDQPRPLCDRAWVLIVMYAHAHEQAQLVLEAAWVEQSFRSLLLGMTTASQGKTAQSTQAWFP